MYGSRLLPIIIAVVAAIYIFSGSLEPLPRYYIVCTSFVAGAAILLTYHWRDIDNRWMWLGVTVVALSVILYFDYPRD